MKEGFTISKPSCMLILVIIAACPALSAAMEIWMGDASAGTGVASFGSYGVASGVAAEKEFYVTGQTGTVTYTLVSGEPPEVGDDVALEATTSGATLNIRTAKRTARVTYNITIQATDQSAPPQTANFVLTLTLVPFKFTGLGVTQGGTLSLQSGARYGLGIYLEGKAPYALYFLSGENTGVELTYDGINQLQITLDLRTVAIETTVTLQAIDLSYTTNQATFQFELEVLPIEPAFSFVEVEGVAPGEHAPVVVGQDYLAATAKLETVPTKSPSLFISVIEANEHKFAKWEGRNLPDGLTVHHSNFKGLSYKTENEARDHAQIRGKVEDPALVGVHTVVLWTSINGISGSKLEYEFELEVVEFSLDVPVRLDVAGFGEPYLSTQTIGFSHQHVFTGFDRTWTATGLPGGLDLATSGGEALGRNDDVVAVSGVASEYSVTPYTVSFALSFPQVGLNEYEVATEFEFWCVEDASVRITLPDPIPDVVATEAYDVNLVVSGGLAPYEFHHDASTLPEGLSIDQGGSNTWRLSGTAPYEAFSVDAYSITLSVRDSLPAAETMSVTFDLRVVVPDLVLTTGALQGTRLGADFETTLETYGGVSPFAWQIDGLPGGLVVTPERSTRACVISGAPTEAGVYALDLTLSDASIDVQTVRTTLTLTVVGEATMPLSFVTTSLPVGDAGQTYGPVLLEATGGDAPYDWSATRSLPSGLEVVQDGGTWMIAGVIANHVSGLQHVELVVQDASQGATRSAIMPLAVRPVGSSPSKSQPEVGSAFGPSLVSAGSAAGCSQARAGRRFGLSFVLFALILLGLRRFIETRRASV